MAGSKSTYTDAMRRGHNLAWDGHDSEAIQEYRRALAEYPDDLAANTSLGSALLRLRQFAEALAAFEMVRRKAPQDLIALAKLAEVQAALGKGEEAGAAYQALATAYAAAGLPARALSAWQQMANLLPEFPAAHLSWARRWARPASRRRPAGPILAAARLYRKAGKFPEAVESLERAILSDATQCRGLRPAELPARRRGSGSGRRGPHPQPGDGPRVAGAAGARRLRGAAAGARRAAGQHEGTGGRPAGRRRAKPRAGCGPPAARGDAHRPGAGIPVQGRRQRGPGRLRAGGGRGVPPARGGVQPGSAVPAGRALQRRRWST